jgi:hypothetical protein
MAAVGKGCQSAPWSYVTIFNRQINGVIHMIELKRVLACGVLLLSSSFGAQAAETTYVFASLTGIQDDGTKLSLTGVLVSTTTLTTLALGPVPDAA